MSYPLAREIAFKKNSYGNFYNKVRRLLREGLIIERTAIDLECVVLQLTKVGFDFLKSDLGELRENRFAAQSVRHDYWATAVQIGEFIETVPPQVKFLTEQELQCTDDSLLPEWVPKSRSHIPDGLTRINSEKDSTVIAFEVELNLKPMLRYDKAAYYFDAGLSKFDVVIWACANQWIAQEIATRLSGLRLRNLDIHHFMLTTDFRSHGWDALIDRGVLNGKSLREIYLLKGYGKPMAPLSKGSLPLIEKIFFATSKSPKGLNL